MTAGAIVFGIFALGLIAFFVLRPIVLTEKTTKRVVTATELNAEESAIQLRTRLEGLLISIRDLDFDYDTGKVSNLVYAEQRKLLIGRAISTLIQLDQAEAHLVEVDDEIEKAVSQYRTVGSEKVGSKQKQAKRVSV
ncbi:MAG: hypothetical protein K8L91_13145 [Anaerolineae bacterium]|nr:hypothetical protein [Anaerolineae bacterium]